MRTTLRTGTRNGRRTDALRALLVGTVVVLAAGCGTTTAAVPAGDVQDAPADEASVEDAHDARLNQLQQEHEAQGEGDEATSGARDSWETTLTDAATDAHDSSEGQVPQ